MHNSHHHDRIGEFINLILAAPFMLALGLYVLAGIISSKKYKTWPLKRYFYFTLGILCATGSVFGPIATRAHSDFTSHMIGHLLLGMIAPLFIALSKPVTLVLRSVNVRASRSITKILKSEPLCLLSNPIVASLLNVGGLWILYTTDLYMLMKENVFLHILIHIHVFSAGYLFTISLIYMDPAPHRNSFLYRTIVMIIAFAGHGILAKNIYAHPPSGVPVEQAEIGAMLMYYGGDIVDIAIIMIFCYQWYKVTRPKTEWVLKM
jgi:putative membrane protein